MDEKNKTLYTYTGELLTSDSIIRIEEIDEDTYFFHQDGTRSKSVLSIDVLEWELPKDIFIRVHPKHLINNNFSKKLFTVHTQWIELENGEKIPISNELSSNKKLDKRKTPKFQWFKSLRGK